MPHPHCNGRFAIVEQGYVAGFEYHELQDPMQEKDLQTLEA
jgi:hypothetical protein